MSLFAVEKLVNGITVLDLHGRLVLGEETEQLRKRIQKLISEGHRKLALDLGEVSYIDSSGLSTLITAFISVRKQGGDLKLIRLTGRVSDIMQITKLSTVFENYGTMEEVERSYSATPESP